MVDILQVIVALDILALCAAVAMTVQAYRAHRVLGSQQSLAFFTAFLLIVMGLLSRMATDVLVEVGPPYITQIEGLGLLISYQKIFLLVAALFLMSAYTMLLLVVERIHNKSMWLLVSLLIILTIFLARDTFVLVHILSIILLGLLAHRFYMNFLSRRSTNALIVYVAFIVLVAAHVASLLIPLSRLWHVAFLGLRLVGYFSLFAVSWRIARG